MRTCLSSTWAVMDVPATVLCFPCTCRDTCPSQDNTWSALGRLSCRLCRLPVLQECGGTQRQMQLWLLPTSGMQQLTCLSSEHI